LGSSGEFPITYLAGGWDLVITWLPLLLTLMGRKEGRGGRGEERRCSGAQGEKELFNENSLY
jgi:hypothetical protein